MKGLKKKFIEQLVEMARKDKDIYLITGDLGFNLVEPFEKEFPDRFINAGIAEQNMIGVAAGLALSGKKVFVYSIIPFLTMRAFEQIRNDLCYQKLNVVLVGYGAGFTYGTAGSSHHALCDISIMRSLPNMTILSPYDVNQTKMCVKNSLKEKGPVYIRLGKAGTKMEKHNYGIPKEISMGKSKIVIISTGQICDECIDMQMVLNSQGYNVDFVMLHKLKPLSTYFLKRYLDYDYIITVEEHSIIGGLGSIIAETLAEIDCKAKLIRFGVNDEFAHEIGSQKYLRKKYKLDGESLLKEVLKIENFVHK